MTFQNSDEIIISLGKDVSRFHGKTILITGSSGFLGKNFVHFFYTLNLRSNSSINKCRVYCVDNLIRKQDEHLSMVFSDENFFFYQQDILLGIQNIGVSFDFIIHAATIASPLYYRQYPIETMDANVIGLRQILDWSIANRPESVLFFSSSEIYGNPDVENIPTKESYNGNVSCTGPRACYDESKRYGETLCVNFYHKYGVPVKIARPFNNYGPGLSINDGRLISDIFKNIKSNEDIVLYSDGNATRTFCYVSDALTGYLKLILSRCNADPFNIGSVKPEISVTDLARLCLEVSGSNLRIVHKINPDKDYITDNPQRRCPDMSKSFELLSFSSVIDLEEGLKRTYKFYLES